MNSLKVSQCSCICDLLKNHRKKVYSDEKLNRELFLLPRTLLNLNNKSYTYSKKKYDEEKYDKALSEAWTNSIRELVIKINTLNHDNDCEFVNDIKLRLKNDLLKIEYGLFIYGIDYFIKALNTKKAQLIDYISEQNEIKIIGTYRTIYYYEKLILLLDETSKVSIQEVKLSLAQIALIYYYNNLGHLTLGDVSDSVAKKYGYTSGAKLYNHYRIYKIRVNRTGKEETLLKTKNKISLIESIREYINDENFQKYNDELNKLKTNYLSQKSDS